MNVILLKNQRKYIKRLLKMMDFDDITGENKKNIIQIDLKFSIIHTEYYLLEALDQEKQTHYFKSSTRHQ